MSTATSTRRAAAAAVLLAAAVAPAAAQLLAVVDLGVITHLDPVVRTLTITNPSGRVARVDVLSACSCLAVEPGGFVLEPGAISVARITYTPEGRPGEITRYLLVKSTLPELDNRRILVGGSQAGGTGAAAPSDCDECRKMEELFGDDRVLGDLAGKVLLVDFYGDLDCGPCREYLDAELPGALRASPRVLRLAQHSVLEPRVLDQLTRRLDGVGETLRELPIAFVGDRPYQGLAAIRSGMRAALVARAR